MQEHLSLILSPDWLRVNQQGESKEGALISDLYIGALNEGT